MPPGALRPPKNAPLAARFFVSGARIARLACKPMNGWRRYGVGLDFYCKETR
jgi:hypothetical protein